MNNAQVQNGEFQKASLEEAILGKDNEKYLTPFTTKEVVSHVIEGVQVGVATAYFKSDDMQHVKDGWLKLLRLGDIVFLSRYWSTFDTDKKGDRKIIFKIPSGFRNMNEEPLMHQVPYNVVYQNNTVIQDGRILKTFEIDVPIATSNSHGHYLSGFWITNDNFTQ